MSEIWKDIEGYPGYQVSNEGRVRSYGKVTNSARRKNRKWKDRILAQKIGKDNCCKVELWAGGEHKTFLVHRLEAKAFLGDPEDEQVTVNHKDGNRLNNSIENLEWMSRGDNIRHGFVSGLYHNQKACSLTSAAGNTFTFRSCSEASRFLGRSHSYVTNCLKRSRHAVGKDGSEWIIE